MSIWLWILLLAGIGALIYTFREFLEDHLGDFWSDAMDIPSEMLEVFSGMFTNLFEFSPAGMLFGLGAVGIIYIFQGSVFGAFSSFSGFQKILWETIIWIGSFGMGYLIGNRVFSE